MISFVVIGKNVEFTIELCLDSIFRFIHSNKIGEYEVIYVDSNSTDSSIQLVNKFPVDILLITGEVNSAIGRNVGAKNTKADTIFFIDGDMELLPDFYKYVFNPLSGEPIHPFINGYLCHRFYDEKFQFLYSKCEDIPPASYYRNVTGGLMIVKRIFWEKLNGMDERLIRNQDLDFGLRMSKSGMPALLYNSRFAIHHTRDYFIKSRYSDFYFSKALFSPGLLMRKHIFYSAYLRRQYQQVIYVAILIAAIIMLITKPIVGISILIGYTLIQASRIIRNPMNGKFLLQSFLFKFLSNFYCLLGLLLYYPPKPKYFVNRVENKTI